ncbi:hypothetical protein L6164_018319 [Bauhinia variegata]|uniref:Uncharacterized protein n=1 Tax=Bauhinia variegata TaxID=167791 RepID=A0ACB9NC80_BAUVA|nr:hypothetical protein L6164_018319 [Bauhinia variegata]
MAMSGILGGFPFPPRTLFQLLTFRPLRPESLIIKRGAGPRRSKIDDGRGAQHNGIGTMNSTVEENKSEVTGSNNNIQRDNRASEGNAKLNNTTTTANSTSAEPLILSSN